MKNYLGKAVGVLTLAAITAGCGNLARETDRNGVTRIEYRTENHYVDNRVTFIDVFGNSSACDYVLIGDLFYRLSGDAKEPQHVDAIYGSPAKPKDDGLLQSCMKTIRKSNAPFKVLLPLGNYRLVDEGKLM